MGHICKTYYKVLRSLICEEVNRSIRKNDNTTKKMSKGYCAKEKEV